MNKNIRNYLALGAFIILLIGLALLSYPKKENSLKLYWFIPDGVRAETDLFTIYEWAEEGKLPNIKKLIETGSYGYSKPTFPSHTPTNFATLLTGTYPEIHGVDDGPMHVEGKPLDKVAIGGFRSVAKKIEPIWTELEDNGEKVALVSMPGSTPPEINSGVVLRGRWGGWGADYQALNFESKGDLKQRVSQGRGSRLFFFGPQLTRYLDAQEATGWSDSVPASFSTPLEAELSGWGESVFAYIYDSTDDEKVNYDRIAFSLDKAEIFSDLAQGDWGEWLPVDLSWEVEDNQVSVPSDLRVHIIKLEEDGFFRIRILYNNLNKHITQPASAAEVMNESAGPMVDFVDNFPPQLIYYPEDKDTFLDEMNMSFDWHKDAVGTVIKQFSPNIVIHDIYSPNQMLTSRWWMGYIDPNSTRYNDVTQEEREVLWNEVKDMYVKLDNIVGEILNNADSNTYIVFSSDHGAVPLDRWVRLNNFFAKKGWLKFTIDPSTGEPVIDWENSQVIYLKMAHVYINPEGLDGDYRRASGEEYLQLRNEVKEALLELEDSNGFNPVVDVVYWEDAKDSMRLDPERVGDLVIANAPGYGWNEEMAANLEIFSEPLKTGYKQAIYTDDVPGMWTPFIISGPGIKKDNYLGEEPIDNADQYPTIMKALGLTSTHKVQGTVVEVFE